MFIFGEKDAFSDAATGAAAVAKLFPTAKRETYAGAGHWVFFEAAERFNRDLAAFTAAARLQAN